MPIYAPAAQLWTLSADRTVIGLQLPPLRLADLPKPLDVHLDFDAETVDAILERLTVLPAQMDPPPPVSGAAGR
jgi:hypothetical protein